MKFAGRSHEWTAGRASPLRPKSVDRVGDENANAEYDQADNRGVK